MDDDDDRIRADALLGRYEIRNRVSRTGMSIVYRAWDRIDERHVALKVSRTADGESNATAWLRQEAGALIRLRHPFIVEALDAGPTSDGRHFLALEWLDGPTLHDFALRLHARMPFRLATLIATQLLTALGALHDEGWVHRDIKPQNVMLTAKSLKLIDFGLVGRADPAWTDALTRPGRFVGTPNYAAPERAHGEPGDARSDLFSCGFVLYELLTRRRPFPRGEVHGYETLPQCVADLIPFADAAPGVEIPTALQGVVLRLLEREPNDRFQSADEAYEALIAAVS